MSRRSRLRAVACDLALYAGGQIVVGAMAMLFFMLRTGGGERDLSSSTATVGWAIALAAAPAWLGLLGYSYSVAGGTPGQSGAGLVVEGSPVRRLARLAAHPLSVLGWMWLALVSALATVPGVPFLLVAAALIALTGGAISAVMLLRDPSALALHDRFAGTRLVAR